MDKYTIFCTPEQTKKALCLGALIDIKYGSIRHRPSLEELKYLFAYNEYWHVIPTAEQMIGWLEENGILDIVISRRMSPKTYGYTVWFSENTFVQEKHSFNSRREATLVAITVALEHLENNKQQTL